MTAAKLLVREWTFQEYFDCSMADTSDSEPDQFEVIHIGHLSSIPAGLWGVSKFDVVKLFEEYNAKLVVFHLFRTSL